MSIGAMGLAAGMSLFGATPQAKPQLITLAGGIRGAYDRTGDFWQEDELAQAGHLPTAGAFSVGQQQGSTGGGQLGGGVGGLQGGGFQNPIYDWGLGGSTGSYGAAGGAGVFGGGMPGYGMPGGGFGGGGFGGGGPMMPPRVGNPGGASGGRRSTGGGGGMDPNALAGYYAQQGDTAKAAAMQAIAGGAGAGRGGRKQVKQALGLQGKGLGIGKLMRQMQAEYNQARKANQNRYRNIKQGYAEGAARQEQMFQGIRGQYADLRDRNMARIDQLGGTERQDIMDAYTRMGARAEQDLVSRGLGNTTIRPTVHRGIQADQTRELGALNERLLRQRVMADESMTGALLGYRERYQHSLPSQLGKLQFMERRTDAYPDMGMFTQLIGQAAAAPMGGFGGGGFSYSSGGGGGGGGGSAGPNVPQLYGPGGMYTNQLQQMAGLYGAGGLSRQWSPLEMQQYQQQLYNDALVQNHFGGYGGYDSISLGGVTWS